jgi:hypothetical protein
MKFGSLLTVLAFAVYAAGCAPPQPYLVAPQINDAGSQGAQVGNSIAAATTAASAADAHPVAVRALPYKGRLLDGDPTELPPAVANALSKDAPLTFFYREELTHDEYHIPLIVSAFDPVTYLGAPLGDYGVTASASLTISEGNRVIADYTAKAHVSKSYNVYSEPKHSELERAALDAVRERIDQKLYGDADRVAKAVVTE